MDLIQLSNTIGEEVIQKLFEASLIPGVAFGFAAGAALHLIGFSVFRTLSFLNTK